MTLYDRLQGPRWAGRFCRWSRCGRARSGTCVRPKAATAGRSRCPRLRLGQRPRPGVFSRPRQDAKPTVRKGASLGAGTAPASRLVDRSRSRPRRIRCARSRVHLLMGGLRGHTARDADAIGHLGRRGADVRAGPTSGRSLEAEAWAPRLRSDAPRTPECGPRAARSGQCSES